MNPKIHVVEKKHLKPGTMKFDIGDTVKVYTRVQEGEKTRTQVFEGTVIRRRGSGTRETFTVLRDERGDQIEKVFPLHSPTVEKVVVSKAGRRRHGFMTHLRKRKEISG